jgi:5'-deoxynucleotidase YfbR-like HD superfamily hydrolase
MDGQQIAILKNAIVKAYDQEELEVLLLEKMNLAYRTITQGDKYINRVAYLVQYLYGLGHISQFIRSILEEKPDSPWLKSIEIEFREFLVMDLESSSPPENTSNNSTPFPLYVDPIDDVSNDNYIVRKKPKLSNNLSIAIAHNEDLCDNLIQFAKITTLDQNNENLDTIKLIESIPLRQPSVPNPIFSIILKGGQGTGKTTFLSGLYSLLESNYSPRKNPNNLTPLYVNLTDHVGKDYIDDVQRSIKSDLKEIEKLISLDYKNDQAQFILMIDGLTAREIHFSRFLATRILQEDILLDKLDAIIWSVSDEVVEREINSLLERKENQKLQFYDYKTIRIQSIQKDDKRFEEFLRLFIILHGEIHVKKLSTRHIENKVLLLKKLIEKLKIDNIDQYVLSIIYEKMEDEAYKEVRTKARYLEKFCEDTFKVSTEELTEVAELAYRIVVNSFYSDPNITRPEILKITPSDRQHNHWQFIIENKVIADFLASWYIIKFIDKAGLGTSLSDEMKQDILNDLFGYDFPRSMNTYAKELIANCQDGGHLFIRGIDRILKFIKGKENMGQTMNILCYFWGRSSEASTIQGGLDNIKTMVWGKVDKSINLNERERVNLKTQFRTIAVSYMSLKIEEISKDFLLRLLSDPEMASIDRGYHRIYYGDAQPYKDKVPHCYLDLEKSEWSNSFSEIKKNINEESKGFQDSDEDKLFPISYKLQHLAFTLTSFVQSRLCHKLYDSSYSCLNDEQINFTLEVVNTILERGEGVLEELKQYLITIKCDIENNYTSWNFIIELYRLKWTPRNGWLKREIQEHFDFGRIESVADHTLFTIYLAHLLLPEHIELSNSTEKYYDYDKNQVKDILTFHDILEVYTNDLIYYYMSDTQKEKAKQQCEQALNYIRYKDTYSSIYGTNKIFQNYIDMESNFPKNNAIINVKIARDIDKLENLIQLHIYQHLYPTKIHQSVFDEFKNNLVDKIQTIYVKKLVDDFISWSKNCSNCTTSIRLNKSLFNSDELLSGLQDKIHYPPDF